MLIDTHAHVNFSAFKDDADEVIKRALKNGVLIINVGSQYSTSVRAAKMAEQYETGVWAAAGLHPVHLQKKNFSYQDDNEMEPTEIKTNGEIFDYQKYLELAKNPKVVAIGEMGLDYHHFMEGDNIPELKTKQKEVFLEGIKLANEVSRPLIIHCWDAYGDLLEILKNNEVIKKGIVHSFVGGYKTAGKFTDLGYKIGLNGVITYSDSFNRLIKELKPEEIVLETDCPYLAPVPKKGERNEPLYVKYIVKKIAEIKEISEDEVARITTNNARQIFSV